MVEREEYELSAKQRQAIEIVGGKVVRHKSGAWTVQVKLDCTDLKLRDGRTLTGHAVGRITKVHVSRS